MLYCMGCVQQVESTSGQQRKITPCHLQAGPLGTAAASGWGYCDYHLPLLLQPLLLCKRAVQRHLRGRLCLQAISRP